MTDFEPTSERRGESIGRVNDVVSSVNVWAIVSRAITDALVEAGVIPADDYPLTLVDELTLQLRDEKALADDLAAVLESFWGIGFQLNDNDHPDVVAVLARYRTARGR